MCILLDVERAAMFALERQASTLEERGDVRPFVEELKRLVAMLPPSAEKETGEMAVDSLTNHELVPQRRSATLRVIVNLLRDLQRDYCFLPTPPIDGASYVAFLRAAKLEDARISTGSDAVSLHAVAERAKLRVEVVDRAAGRALQEGLVYFSGLDETAYAILLDHEQFAIAWNDLARTSDDQMFNAGAPATDIGLLTIKDEEFAAVLNEFQDDKQLYKSARTQRIYNLRSADAGDGQRYRVAICRAFEQGNGEAQSVVRDMIDDLSPKLLLLVGIAGGAPSQDYSLGDVVLSLRVNDYTLHAVNADSSREYAVGGGPMMRSVVAHVANLQAYVQELAGWHDQLPSRPQINVRDSNISGSVEWVDKVKRSLGRHFDENARDAPLFVSGVIGSSDAVIKDSAVLAQWLSTARNVLAVEMETAGAYRAATGPDGCAMLAIRGISDIVGLQRDERWTRYACSSAAAFARAYLLTRPVEPVALPVLSLSGVPRVDGIARRHLDSLAAFVAAERAAALDGLDELLSRGLPPTSALVDGLERIALNQAAPQSERWRAIEILRKHTGMRAQTMASLVIEFAADSGSTIFATTHDTGQVYFVISSSIPAMDMLTSTLHHLDEPADIVLRETLSAMSTHLRQRSRQVGQARATQWRSFANSLISRFPSQASIVIDLIEGK
jgi:nucleoside phosphorylase